MISRWITDTLAQSSEFQGRPERMQVQGALDRVARGVLLERDAADGDGETRPMKLAGSPPPTAEPPTTRLRVPAAAAGAEAPEAPTRPFRPHAAMPPRPAPRLPRR